MLAGARGEGEGRFALLWRVANKFGLIKFQARHKQKRERGGEGCKGAAENVNSWQCAPSTQFCLFYPPPRTPSLPRCTPEKNATSKSEIFVRQLIKNFRVPRVCVCARVCARVCVKWRPLRPCTKHCRAS